MRRLCCIVGTVTLVSLAGASESATLLNPTPQPAPRAESGSGGADSEAIADVSSQLRQMQQMMQSMAQLMESQQKQIDDQKKVISELKTVTHYEIGSSPASQALNGPEPAPDYRRREDNGEKEKEKKPDHPRRSWELEPVTVTGEREAVREPGALREEDKIGDYGQPRWTARRRFSETREYVIPKGDFEFEYWSIIEVPRKTPHDATGKEPVTFVETRYEAEIGLPERFQLDLYANSHSQGNNKGFLFDQQSAEMRYAFANWGVIPGNPTLYTEYTFNNKPEADHVEFKLLFSGEAAKRWHWAYNQVYEHEMGGLGTNSYESTGGISYTVLDERFSVGGEYKLAYADQDKNRGLHSPEVLVGPSIQFSPLKSMHIDFAPLIGTSKRSDQFKSLFIVGWEF